MTSSSKDAADHLADEFGVVLPDSKSFSDLGNAERLIADHTDRIRFCHEWDKWLVWDACRWAPNIDGAIYRLAVQTIRGMYTHAGKLTIAAAQMDNIEARLKYVTASEALTAWARKTESRGRIEAMVFLARSLPGIPAAPSLLDRNPWQLNCRNGTLDLVHLELLPHDPADMITKLAPVDYDPDATFRAWDTFLERILPDELVRGFVQRSLGYSLTGVTTEEKLFFPYGPTGTGKSTLLRAVGAAMGDYAANTDFGTFLAQDRTGKPNDDIARLNGRRFITSIEVESGQKLAESLVKQVTGGDVITARFLYGHSFEFVPVFKLWLAANNRPRVRDDDDANWRRIIQIAFDQQIPESEQDGDVKLALADCDVAGPAVLAWLAEGCRLWQLYGLNIPDAVRATTKEYRDEMDPLADFVEEKCVLHYQARCENPSLWAAYNQWANSYNVKRPLGRKNFTQRMGTLEGVEFHRNGSGRFWQGIGLAKDTE